MAKQAETQNVIYFKSHVIPGSPLYIMYSQKSTGKNSWEEISLNPCLLNNSAFAFVKYLKLMNLIFYKQTRAGKPLGSSSDFQIFFSPKSPKKFESTRRLNFCPRDWAAAAFLFSGLYFFDHCVECRGNK